MIIHEIMEAIKRIFPEFSFLNMTADSVEGMDK